MKSSSYSIRRRLALFAAIAVVTAMILTGFALSWQFQRQIERRVAQELDAHLQQIIGGIRFGKDNSISLSRPLADPRFGKVFGGLYYQVETEAGEVKLRSRSLWDTVLDLPNDMLTAGAIHIHKLPGPRGSELLVHESNVEFVSAGRKLDLRISVGIDLLELDDLKVGFSKDLQKVLSGLGLLLILGFSLQIYLGLMPVSALQQTVSEIRSGLRKRIDRNVPSEVSPLVDEVNNLLDQQDKNMLRARDRAADLAHGLKTPLTALRADVRKLRKAGQIETANDIEDLVKRMQRHLDRELARSRIRHARARTEVSVKEATSAVIRALEKTPEGSAKTFETRVDDNLYVAMEHADLLDVLGNLLENATRFAKQTIRVEATKEANGISIKVSDDGIGVSNAQLESIKARGVRLDMADNGSGLGLAIVSDIVEAYGARIELGKSDLGGLSACISSIS